MASKSKTSTPPESAGASPGTDSQSEPGPIPTGSLNPEPGAVSNDPAPAPESPASAPPVAYFFRHRRDDLVPTPTEAPRGRGRPKGSSKARNLNPAPGGAGVALPDKFRPAAEATVSFIESVAVGVISGEWKFRDDGEKNMLVDATEKYFRHTNIPDLPPGLVLIACIGIYAAPRLSMPETQKKIALLKGKIRGTVAPVEIPPVQ